MPERRITPEEWLAAYPGLKSTGSQIAGPCPNCGGTDRFWVSRREPFLFGCRQCNDGRAILEAAGFVRPEPPEPQTPQDRQPHEVERLDYHNPTTGENITTVIERYRMACWRNDCHDRYPHKHVLGIERAPGLQGQQLPDGFTILIHRPVERGEIIPEYDIHRVKQQDIIISDSDNARIIYDANGHKNRLVVTIKDPSSYSAFDSNGNLLVIVIAESGKSADAIAAAGWPSASYPAGPWYACRADYSPVKGLKVFIAPDNDYIGRKAALESAKGCLIANASYAEILETVGRAGSGYDLADVDMKARVDNINDINGTAISFFTVFQVDLELSILALNHSCSVMPRSRLPLIDSTGNNDFFIHVNDARRYTVDYHVHKKDDPTLYEWMGSVAYIAQSKTGKRPAKHNRASGTDIVAEAMIWHRGWESDPIANLEMSEPQILEAFRNITPIEHGHVVKLEADLESRTKKPERWELFRPRLWHPFTQIVDTIVDHVWDGIPLLKAIRNHPILNEEGNKLQYKNGYSWDTHCYMDMPHGLDANIPVDDAVAEIEYLIKGFPFVTEADKVNYFALLVTPIIAPAVNIKPLAYINKATPRTGATKLAKLASFILSGYAPSEIGPMARPEEEEKRLSTAANDSTGFLLFDNFDGVVASLEIERYLTSEPYQARLLGQNQKQMLIYRQHITDIMTGNNAQFSQAMSGRTYSIRLDARMPNPESRIFDLDTDKYVENNRIRLLSCVVSLVNHWLKLGCPDDGRKSVRPQDRLGSFEQWQDIVADVLWSCGFRYTDANRNEYPLFCTNRESLISQTVHDGGDNAFIQHWFTEHSTNPVTVATLADPTVVGDDNNVGILEINANSQRGRQISLGRRLKKMLDRTYPVIIDGIEDMVSIRHATKGPNGTDRYKLEIERMKMLCIVCGNPLTEDEADRMKCDECE